MNILFIDIVHPILQERLEANGMHCLDATNMSKEECIKLLPSMNGIVIRSRFRMDASFLANGDNLKFIARSGAGMENIDVDYCESKNIMLFNAPEGNRNAVGEHALGMLLSLFNNLNKGDREIRNGIWDREGNRGLELEGKTVGVIGYGNNGEAFCKKLRGFDCKVLAYDKYKSGFDDEFVTESTMNDLYDQCDVISFHIPQNDETIYFGNDNFFNAFKKPIYLINLSRGKVVQTSALVQAMKANKVLGACLDVLEYEKASFESFFEQSIPEDFQYLLKSDRTILSPHVGGWTVESYFKLSDVLADKILQQFS